MNTKPIPPSSVLGQVYLKYSGLENVPGEDKTMSVNEWTTMVEQANVMDEFLVDRSVRLAYVRSKEVGTHTEGYRPGPKWQ
jgi:hypothetical protein